MNNIEVIAPDQFITTRWRNGQGSTSEILRENLQDNDAFAWRISKAAVTEDGRFSDFSGYDRTLVLLDGKGMRLEHEFSQSQELLEPLELSRFSGAETTAATLVDGPISDFNVMTNPGLFSADVSCVNSEQDTVKEVKVCSDNTFLVYAHQHATELSWEQAENPASENIHSLKSRSMLIDAGSLFCMRDICHSTKSVFIKTKSSIYVTISPLSYTQSRSLCNETPFD